MGCARIGDGGRSYHASTNPQKVLAPLSFCPVSLLDFVLDAENLYCYLEPTEIKVVKLYWNLSLGGMLFGGMLCA